jgi:cobalt-zinc-cadmium efflux system outer membrane protein
MRRVWSCAVAVLACASSGAAEDVTEEAFLAALGADQFAPRALGEDLARAEAARRRAGTLENPRLDFWREQPDPGQRVTNWTLAWTPPLGRYGLGKRAADAGVAAAREGLLVEAAGLRRRLRQAFAEWSASQTRRELLAGRLARVSELAEQERQRARVGTESGFSARRLTLAEAEARHALREAEAAAARAEAEARAWNPSLPAGAAPVPPEVPAPPENVDASVSPRVRGAERQLEQAEREARLAGRFLTFPTLQAGIQRIEDRGVVASGPILAAGWSIPLFDRNQAARTEAKRRAEIAAARVQQSRALARAQVEGGLAAYRALVMSSTEASAASAETERVIEAATAAYRAGETTLTDLLDALGAAFEARLREVDARAAALAGHRELEDALARPLTNGGSR